MLLGHLVALSVEPPTVRVVKCSPGSGSRLSLRFSLSSKPSAPQINNSVLKKKGCLSRSELLLQEESLTSSVSCRAHLSFSASRPSPFLLAFLCCRAEAQEPLDRKPHPEACALQASILHFSTLFMQAWETWQIFYHPPFSSPQREPVPCPWY